MATSSVAPVGVGGGSGGSGANAPLFSRNTQALIYSMRTHPVQRMLDFDYLCRRERPSVVGVVHPGAKIAVQKVFFGATQVSLPVFRSLSEAAAAFPAADVLINYSHRSNVFQSTLVALGIKSIRTIIITSEGVPENDVRRLIAAASRYGKMIIGPGTVGGLQAGAFKIGDSAGTAENVLACKLYRPGSVGVVCKSSGILNELCLILARATDGLYEGIVVGADQYVFSTLLDHAVRLQSIDEVKMIVVVGEPGGTGEYDIADAVRSGVLTKPVVAWVLGQCGESVVPVDLRYGRASTFRISREEGALAKTEALRKAGAVVPTSFDTIFGAIANVYKSLVESGQLIPAADSPVQFSQHPALSRVPQPVQQQSATPRVPSAQQPMSGKPSAKAQQQQPQPQPGKVTGIVSSICDDRGDEPLYSGIPLSQLVQEEAGVGDTIALLWFKRRVPQWVSRFLDLVIVLMADKGPCVCAAHSAIVASRAGKDNISCLCAGLLNIGPRYGGGADDAARCFMAAVESRLTPDAFIERMRKDGVVIRGIGGPNALKGSLPDRRTVLLKQYAAQHFPSHKYLDFALEVEKITVAKAKNLILNIDGVLGVLFLDMMNGSPAFTTEEARELVNLGCLGSLFALSRSIGILGHTIDQKRLKQPLYRHPYDDVTFVQQNLV